MQLLTTTVICYDGNPDAFWAGIHRTRIVQCDGILVQLAQYGRRANEEVTKGCHHGGRQKRKLDSQFPDRLQSQGKTI